MATVINQSGKEDAKGVYKTYYLRILHKGRFFWKIGQTVNRIQDRFKKEPPECEIVIVDLWHHTTALKCDNHEAKLFKLYKSGALPYIGKTGPLRGGGNTEVFCHDVMGGEAPPERVQVVAWNEDGWQDRYEFFADFDPYELFPTGFAWLQRYYAPPTLSYLVPNESSEKRIVVADCALVQSIDDGTGWNNIIKKKSIKAALEASFIVTDYQAALDAVRSGEFESFT